MSRPLSSLSPSEEQFCHSYCTFLNAQGISQHTLELANAFHAQYQQSDAIDYPDAWAINQGERAKATRRFLDLTEPLLSTLPPPDTTSKRSSFIMSQVKRMCYFLAVGLVASFFLKSIGVQALPSNSFLEAVNAPRDVTDDAIFFKGTHTDNTTGVDFDLYVMDDHLTHEEALAEFYASAEDESLVKRDWYNCHFPRANYIQKFCCNTGHALGGFISATGATVMGIQLSNQLTAAFNGSRDKKSPRSICLTRDGKRLCTSWATYSADKATAAEEDDIVKYSVACAKSGGSAEFKTTATGGGDLFICVSNRPDGCHANVG